MGARIQHTFQSLYRELDLQDPLPQMELESTVVPVVLLHEHCHGDRIGFGAAGLGPLSVGDLTTALALPREGAYALHIQIQASTAVALVGTVEHITLQDRARGSAAGSYGRTIGYWYYGNTEMRSLVVDVVYPKVHFEPGRELAFVMTALLANDFINANCLVQPV